VQKYGNMTVIPACRVCHSDLFGIILKKDAGQASMTDGRRIADKSVRLATEPQWQKGTHMSSCLWEY